MIEWLIGAVVAVIGVLAYGWKKQRDGKKDAYYEMQEQDRAQADAIRDRKRARDADGLRPEDIRYRD